jgi:hypothetical protein
MVQVISELAQFYFNGTVAQFHKRALSCCAQLLRAVCRAVGPCDHLALRVRCCRMF